MAETGAPPLPPTPPAHTLLTRAEQFVWHTARVLEQHRFVYHFLGGSADAVETALSAYRNADEGYGHALEPDLRGPVSQPLHTGHALRVLDSIGRCAGQRAERICRYLTSVSTPDGALPAIHPSQRGYPAAPFLPVVDAPPSDLLATGPVVGLLHGNEVWHAWLFRATDFCWQAVESLERSHPYEVEAAVAFLDSVPDRSRAEAAADRLGRLVRDHRLVVLDPDDLKDRDRDKDTAAPPDPPGDVPGGHHFPYDFARTPDSLARAWFTDEEMARSLDFLAAAQRDDGGWPRPSRSSAHARSSRGHWAPGPELEGRAIVTLEALLTLRAYGRL
ncbi:hypothetical protein GCM10010145_10150 [Streptomyces ruber]|uniref:Prenyltransferase n=2 Tax=Streptomyces TaxID=1883 RepID=A0A918BBI3_9ACTN|nr:hypothetical protein [Streptomyces ruber]GGQ43576.1 hypothetical protein GCM10010145_10150 [Streptomyces ruber]